MSMLRKFLAVLALSVVAMPVLASDMEALDDESMSAIGAYDGISLRIEMLINSDSSGNPLNNASSGGYIDCGAASDPCRFALNFEGRANKWLVFKGYSGILRINDMRLDAQPALNTLGSNTAYYNDAKFKSRTGACLLPGGACSAAAVGLLPALRISYPAVTPTYNNTTFLSSGFTSVEARVRLDGLGAEFGAGATGYLGNANGSFLGALIADVNSPTAGIAFRGNALVYGF